MSQFSALLVVKLFVLSPAKLGLKAHSGVRDNSIGRNGMEQGI